MKSQSHQKILNYLAVYLESDKFQGHVKRLRKRLKIPKGGLALSEKLKEKIEKQGFLKNTFYCPAKIKDLSFSTINDITNIITEDFATKNPSLTNFFKFYILYNEKFYSFLSIDYAIQQNNLCIIEDINKRLELGKGTILDDTRTIKSLKRSFKNYPIIIKIHPSVTGRDLVDFIKKNGKLINSYLLKYKEETSKVGKYRKGNARIKERDQFIYENRHLPKAKIVSLVHVKFPDVWETADEGAVGKIISLQIKLRKEV